MVAAKLGASTAMIASVRLFNLIYSVIKVTRVINFTWNNYPLDSCTKISSIDDIEQILYFNQFLIQLGSDIYAQEYLKIFKEENVDISCIRVQEDQHSGIAHITVAANGR